MDKPYRIAIAGFQHETNTFAPAPATFADFVKHDAWPGLTQGPALLEAVAGMNLPITGFIEATCRQRYELQPMLWCSAEPSAHVTRDAFERIAAMLCQGLEQAGPLDGVYLDLHGAMVTEHYEDGEGEILRRVRAVVGEQIPVVVSLDLHANITQAMVDLATAMTVYRTYPHLDMAATGARVWGLLKQALAGKPLTGILHKPPFLIPLSAQCTDFEPNRSLYRYVQDLSVAGELNADFAAGFPPADIRECGPAVLVYGVDPTAVKQAADTLLAAVMAAEPAFENPLLEADEAVQLAMENTTDQPVVLADAQDNPGAGASSDTVGLLQALVRQRAQGAVMAIINDPAVAAEAHERGVGALFSAELGGKSGQPGQTSYRGTFRVEALGDGRFTCTGEMYRGMHTTLGPMALLRVEDEGVRVIVGSERLQCLDQAIFRHLGVEPNQQRILVVKSTVHFRADFDPIAARTLGGGGSGSPSLPVD